MVKMDLLMHLYCHKWMPTSVRSQLRAGAVPTPSASRGPSMWPAWKYTNYQIQQDSSKQYMELWVLLVGTAIPTWLPRTGHVVGEEEGAATSQN